MKINKRILIFAILVGLLTVLGLSLYINKLENNEKKQGDYLDVVVAVKTIPANVKITSDMVTLKSLHSESVNSQAVTSVEKIIGGISKVELVKDEQVLSSRVVVDAAQATLSYRVPQNMRAVSIPSTEISGVSGFINVGDKIDILVTYEKKEVNPNSTTYTQLQNIEVAAVGNAKASAEDSQKVLPASITVIVKPAQAEVLAYAVANGNLYFSLRNPADAGKADLNFYNGTNFSTYRER